MPAGRGREDGGTEGANGWRNQDGAGAECRDDRDRESGAVAAGPAGAGGQRGGQFLPPREVMIVLPGLLMAILLAMLDNLIVSTALPRIVGDLGGVAHLSWVVTAYILASTITTPFYGKLGDMYGRKTFFVAAIIIFLVGSALSGLSQTMDELIAFRAIQGLGAGGLMVGAMATLGDIVAPRERGQLHELHDGRDDARHHRRPAARRVHHHLVLVALDLLHQHPAGRRGADLPARRPCTCPRTRSSTRSTTWAGRCSPWPRPRSSCWPPGAARSTRGVRRRSSGSPLLTVAATAWVLRHRDAGRRADAAAARLPQPELLAVDGDDLPHRPGHVRRDDVPAAVSSRRCRASRRPSAAWR